MTRKASASRKASERITVKAWALRVGISPQRGYQLKQAERITVGPDGLLDPEEADRQYLALRDPKHDSHRKARVPGGNRLDGDARKLQKSRVIKAEFEAKLAELRFDQEAGKLVPREAVRESLFSASRAVRNSILAVPKRLRSVLAAETNPTKVESLLAAELVHALSSLAEGELAKLFATNGHR